ncbi:hypothetical protein F511_42257 [Dorcoceras hygrometricum]|uniref:Transposase (putative) gypsy type domain-containing protein n=1 Tax=Dorcoceras hygrometricum TaxID=472368 RepID=A0A2Z7B920_9LAMI|nr:hypothetical protein F511_42257 [Dorcoceras hygrometricum]
MCHEPPSGYFTTYLEYFSNGFSLPPHALLVEIVRSLGVSFSQLTPNAIIAFTCFHCRVSQIRIPVTLDLFHALFSARCMGPGKKIDLAEVRALQNGAGRGPMKAPWVRPSRKRVVSYLRDAPRRTGSPRSSDKRSSSQSRQYQATGAMGKTLLTSTGEKAIEGYRASSAFRDEVLQQALTIRDQKYSHPCPLTSIPMIEPSVPEPGDENNEEFLGTLGEILGDIDYHEMIEALGQNPI